MNCLLVRGKELCGFYVRLGNMKIGLKVKVRGNLVFIGRIKLIDF